MPITLEPQATSAMDVPGAIAVIKDTIDRTDLDTQILQAINSVIRKIERKSNFQYMQATKEDTLAAGHYSLDYPVRYKQMIFMHATDGTDILRVKNKDESEARRMFPDLTNNTGGPMWRSAQPHASQFLIRPTADKDYPIEMRHFAFSGAVDTSDENKTHWILSNFPEVIIYGACMELMPILKDWDREPIWRAKYTEALRDLKRGEFQEVTQDEDCTVEGAYA